MCVSLCVVMIKFMMYFKVRVTVSVCARVCVCHCVCTVCVCLCLYSLGFRENLEEKSFAKY